MINISDRTQIGAIVANIPSSVFGASFVKQKHSRAWNNNHYIQVVTSEDGSFVLSVTGMAQSFSISFAAVDGSYALNYSPPIKKGSSNEAVCDLPFLSFPRAWNFLEDIVGKSCKNAAEKKVGSEKFYSFGFKPIAAYLRKEGIIA